jgi:hypothetical protein
VRSAVLSLATAVTAQLLVGLVRARAKAKTLCAVDFPCTEQDLPLHRI